MKKFLLLLAIAIVLLIYFVKQVSDFRFDQKHSWGKDLPADFVRFYDKFHTDIDYQLSHIDFPLKGVPAKADLNADESDFVWKKEEWSVHKKPDLESGEYIREFARISNDFIVENIRLQQAAFGMQRKYAKTDDGWKLVYYVGMNPIK